MKHLNKFNEALDKNKPSEPAFVEILEYLKLCFIDMTDEYGFYDSDEDDNDGVSISHNDDYDTYHVATPMVWTDGVSFGLKNVKIGFDDVNSLVSFGELFNKLSKDVEEGLAKFGSRYNFEHSIVLSEYFEVTIYEPKEK